MKSLEEALAHMLEGVAPLDPESVTLDRCAGRVLAEPLRALLDHPHFDQSAMDGYAVRHGDLASARPESPVSLPVAGESRAGGPPPPNCGPGQAVRIFTGAPTPAGATAVVVQEDTFDDPMSNGGRKVGIRFAPPAGHHIRRRGSSCVAGVELAAAGTRVDSAIVGAAASEGLATLSVRRRPRVYVLGTGDELAQAGAPLRPGAIYDSNGPMLQALVEAHGGEAIRLAPTADSLESMVGAVRVGLGGDLLISSGGVSVGDYDLVRDALSEAGVDLSLWKVAIKPGKPVAFGTRDKARVLGLPGNPVSAFVTFHLFARPLLDRLGGVPSGPPVHVRLGSRIQHSLGRTEFVRARLEQRDAELFALPNTDQSSGALHDLARTDALVRLPSNQEVFEAGALLDAILLRPIRAEETP